MKIRLLLTLGCALFLAKTHAEPAGSSATAPDLRGVYLAKSQGNTADGSQQIGRLAIRHNAKTVSLDHAFQGGDAIQFEISSNENGCVYIFHQGPSGKSALLWPDPQHPVDNCVAAHVSRFIPDDGTIVFDRETGEERFAVVIAPAQQTPDPAFKQFPNSVSNNGAASREEPPPSAEPQRQILVRSPQLQEAQQMGASLDAGARGVSFRPNDGDPYIYFSTESRSGKRWAVTRFRLQHAGSGAAARP